MTNQASDEAAREREERWARQEEAASSATRDIADVPAVEVITTAAVHLMSAAAVKLGLADDPDAAAQLDLDEARKLINTLAGLITAGAPEISDMHARSLRDGLRSLQLAFREASTIPDPSARARARSGQGRSTSPRERSAGPSSPLRTGRSEASSRSCARTPSGVRRRRRTLG